MHSRIYTNVVYECEFLKMTTNLTENVHFLNILLMHHYKGKYSHTGQCLQNEKGYSCSRTLPTR